jgi:hypothetical protein
LRKADTDRLRTLNLLLPLPWAKMTRPFAPDGIVSVAPSWSVPTGIEMSPSKCKGVSSRESVAAEDLRLFIQRLSSAPIVLTPPV